MNIYSLTVIGRKLARSTSSPSGSPSWSIIHYLDQRGASTDEQISQATGLGQGEVRAVTGVLRRKHIVTEVTNQEATF